MNNFPINDKPASKGPMLGTIIIVILIIIGGIYIISSRRSGETTTIPPTDQSDTGTPTSVVPDNGTRTAAALADLDTAGNDLTASEADLKSLETEIK